jgi:RHS repeat-associated protein
VAQRLDSSGNVVSSDLYDAYGNKLAGNPSNDPYGYNGQWGYYTDSETGLILCTHRYYDPANGRWVTRDPIGYAGGVNQYGYVMGNPIGGVDPVGLCTDVKTDCLRRGGQWRRVTDAEYGGDFGKCMKDCMQWTDGLLTFGAGWLPGYGGVLGLYPFARCAVKCSSWRCYGAKTPILEIANDPRPRPQPACPDPGPRPGHEIYRCH